MATRIVAYRPDRDRVIDVEIQDLATLLNDPQAIVWVDLDASGDDEQRLLGEAFRFHPLVIEDVFQEATIPKVEEFEDHIYLIVHGIDQFAASPEGIGTVELDLLVGKRFLVTHHEKAMRSIESVMAELRRNPRALARGPAFTAYHVLDHLTDHFTPVMEQFDDDIERLESSIMREPSPSCLELIFQLKRSLLRVRRMAVHQRELLHRISRAEFELIPPQAVPFYRDVYDRFARVADLLESHREALTTAFEAYLSMQSNRMNEIMKVLTLISTVMLPLTFIAGVYGMNFDVMPELRWKYGYAFAWLLMLAIAVGLIGYFRRKRWI